jgi:Helix-turn-helix domain
MQEVKTMPDTAPYLTINQAADQLGVDRRRIRTLIAEGKLKAFDNPLDKRAKLVNADDIKELGLFPRPSKKAAA